MEDRNQVRICVPVCERGFEALKQASARAAQVGDLVELRLDYLAANEFQAELPHIDKLLNKLDCPGIVTWRPVEQGGQQAFDQKSRMEFWLFTRPTNAQFLDIEVDLVSGFAASDYCNQFFDWDRVICSHHDFGGVPRDLTQIYERLAATPARVLKVAVQADDVTDCIPVFRVLERARKEGREMIAIAMGTAGIATRILGPSRGAYLTYAALERERAAAPGQLTAAELRKLYRIDKIDSQTLIMGLVGKPVAHSVSPHIHNAAFASGGLNAVYIPFEVEDVAEFIKRMIDPRRREIDWNVRGLSVTAPHKSAVINHLDWVDTSAREIGAVNTIVVEQEMLRGYNTDSVAFVSSLIQRAGSLRDSRCAIIGAGGAARTALWSLRQQGAEVTIFARELNKALPLAETFGVSCQTLEAASFTAFDVVINATPLGAAGNLSEQTPAVAAQLRGARLAYDLVYNPVRTRFLREAREAGCDTLGGLGMLVNQAAEQFKLWTDVDPSRDVMWAAAEQALLNG